MWGTSLPHHSVRWRKEQTIPMTRSCISLGVYMFGIRDTHSTQLRAYRGQGHRRERSCGIIRRASARRAREVLHELRRKYWVHGVRRGGGFHTPRMFPADVGHTLMFYCSYTPYRIPNIYDPNRRNAAMREITSSSCPGAIGRNVIVPL